MAPVPGGKTRGSWIPGSSATSSRNAWRPIARGWPCSSSSSGRSRCRYFRPPTTFLDRLDPFLASLPGGFRYGVEVRNPEYLRPSYFSLLPSHGVAHVLNAWTRMPGLGRQAEMPAAFTTDFTVVRALLREGRTYEQAVRTFEPYRLVAAPDHAARRAMVDIAERSMRRKKPAFLFVNNRHEGHAPTTIEAVVDVLLGPRT